MASLTTWKGSATLGRVGQGRVTDRPVGTREVQGGVGDVGEEGGPLGVQPRRGLDPTATRHDVEQLSAFDVHDLGGELLAVVLPLANEEGLVEAQRAHQAVARGVIIHQRGAVGEHGVVHGVPITAELVGDLVDARGSHPPVGWPTGCSASAPVVTPRVASPARSSHPWGSPSRNSASDACATRDGSSGQRPAGPPAPPAPPGSDLPWASTALGTAHGRGSQFDVHS